ncbi:hypothetical protein IAT38_006042 [Cryptococcus sp. DSM 104549]
MKRLFRTSKSPIVDPLPPPPAPNSSSSPPPSGTATPQNQQPIGRSISAIFGGDSSGEAHSHQPAAHHQSHHHEHKWGFGHRHENEVTPFPADAGRESVPPPTQGGGYPGRRKSKEGRGNAAPSLLEIQQMQEQNGARRQFAQPPPLQPVGQQRLSRGYQSSPSPDGWTVVSPPGSNPSSSFPSSQPQPLPVPNASFSQPHSHSRTHSHSNSPVSGSPSSAVSAHTAVFLPPGARPPTPPNARPAYPAHMRYSQSNLHSAGATAFSGGGGEPGVMHGGGSAGRGSGGRERGHSSPATIAAVAAAASRSDAAASPVPTEQNPGSSSGAAATVSNQAHSHLVPTTAAPPSSASSPSASAKLTKPPPPPRSPLSHARYPEPSPDLPPPPPPPDHPAPTAFPAPRPYTPQSGAATPTPHDSRRGSSAPADPLPNPFPPADEMPSTPGLLGQQGSQGRDAQPEQHAGAGAGAPAGKDKEKKRFWGMGMGMGRSDKKGKVKAEQAAQAQAAHAGGHGQLQSTGSVGGGEWRPSTSTEDPRMSMEAWREAESRSTSAHGHSSAGYHDEEPRGRFLGLETGGARRESAASAGAGVGAAQVNDVTSAIRMLCGTSDPSPAAIYDVCDRINHSDSTDSISKEAARALRKEFKHGNESERRNATKVWLLLMRNVTARGFRPYASNKKFFQSLEPILFAPPAKQIVSPSTRKLLVDVIADLTFQYGNERGCESLGEMWKKVKVQGEPDFGSPLPADHPILNPEVSIIPTSQPYAAAHPQAAYPPPPTAQMASLAVRSQPPSRHGSSPSLQQQALPPPPPIPQRMPANYAGPGYANLPNHREDTRRLMEECTAAKETAKLLSEAVVFTQPAELAHKPIVREFYQKVFHAHTSLTDQMEWAQAEAARSRERHAQLTLDGSADSATQQAAAEATPEEKALASLFEAHGMLAEAMKGHDDLERMARDEQELREVRERSKKETRMDRSAMLDPGTIAPPQQQASGSRSPSPAPPARLPRTSASPRPLDSALPAPAAPATTAATATAAGTAPTVPQPQFHPTNPFRGTDPSRSRTPSPDRHPLPHPPRLPNSPSRTNSPLGLSRLRMGGPRPLPNPFKSGNNTSQGSLATAASVAGTQGGGGSGSGSAPPSRSGTGDSSGTGAAGAGGAAGAAAEDDDEEELSKPPAKPSRKALGKRRAVVDEDSTFDPNDMFNPNPTDPRARPDSNNHANGNDSDSDESLAELVRNHKPVVYAYDAYEERQKELKRLKEEAERVGAGGSRAS